MKEPPIRPSRGSPTRGVTIVIVEDEVLIRAGTARYLREAGCIVFEATTAEECLALLASDKSIEIVFADIRLPGQSGLELLRVIQRTYPRVKVVLTTGARLSEPIPEGVTLLKKPYFLFEIERRISVLSGRALPRPGRTSDARH